MTFADKDLYRRQVRPFDRQIDVLVYQLLMPTTVSKAASSWHTDHCHVLLEPVEVAESTAKSSRKDPSHDPKNYHIRNEAPHRSSSVVSLYQVNCHFSRARRVVCRPIFIRREFLDMLQGHYLEFDGIL